jgi:hypothetical protein
VCFVVVVVVVVVLLLLLHFVMLAFMPVPKSHTKTHFIWPIFVDIPTLMRRLEMNLFPHL